MGVSDATTNDAVRWNGCGELSNSKWTFRTPTSLAWTLDKIRIQHYYRIKSLRREEGRVEVASYLWLVQLGERQIPVRVDYWAATDEACATERDTNFKSLNHPSDSAMIQKSTETLLSKGRGEKKKSSIQNT